MELTTRCLKGSQPGPHLLITGGVHGDEFEPMAAIRRLMRELDPGSIRGQVTFVPVVNEAAYLRGHRTAEDGLDLARICPGRADGSVTERTAAALSQLIRSADYYIDLHTGGSQMSVYPLSGYSLHRDPQVLDVQRRMARAFNLPVIWGTSGLPGRSLSVAADAGIPAIYTEYLGASSCSEEGIEAYVAGCLQVMGELGLTEPVVTKNLVRWEVEVPEEGSGHIQAQNLSPMTGFFNPAVALGDSIATGELIGTVTDLMGDETVEVRSQQTGIVLVLRTFRRVLEGDSLGVVLPTADAAG
ncbi:MAG: succinylglutamate desuccinylase/aspartoacylase family protein [Planctomycetaceae bacterium]|nr:succinylglutamate desuccinylase/aspartoacylase family protein [Planctomycetaceae bacterium]